MVGTENVSHRNPNPKSVENYLFFLDSSKNQGNIKQKPNTRNDREDYFCCLVSGIHTAVFTVSIHKSVDQICRCHNEKESSDGYSADFKTAAHHRSLFALELC